jgi:hypothetical protein
VVPNATADGHALNRVTADGRYALLTGATFTGAVTLPASDPTDANHAARKAYVDQLVAAAGVWEKVVDVAVTNSAVIDVTGFSLQDYRMATLLLVGAQASSASGGGVVLQVYRNSSLVNSGYNYVRFTAVASTYGVSTHSASGHVINFDGVDVQPIFMENLITQTASNREVVIMSRSLHVPTGNYNSIVIHHVHGRITAGSGWVNGFRISAPVAFQNNVGRVIVLGLKP